MNDGIKFILSVKKFRVSITLNPFLIVLNPIFINSDSIFKKYAFQWLFLTIEYKEK